MILADIKRYLKTHQQARLSDMAIHFDTPPDAIRGMLDIWVRKGKVARTQVSQACGSSCNKCDEANIEVYRWQGER